jgi:hypothetical protein
MISKTFRIARMIVLASFAVSSAAGATCSNASLSGTYGFLHDGTDSNGAPFTAAVSQISFTQPPAHLLERPQHPMKV